MRSLCCGCNVISERAVPFHNLEPPTFSTVTDVRCAESLSSTDSMKRSQTLVGGLVALLALWFSLVAGLIPVQLSKGGQQMVQLVRSMPHLSIRVAVAAVTVPASVIAIDGSLTG